MGFRFSDLTTIAIISLASTALLLYASIDVDNYEFCMEYKCIKFFFSEFSLIAKIMSFEIAFFGFLVGLSKLKTAEKALLESIRFNSLSERLNNYGIFSEIAKTSILEDDAFNSVSVNTFLLYNSMLSFINSPGENRPDIERLLCIIYEHDQEYRNKPHEWSDQRHINLMKEAFSKIGLNLPETDRDTYFEIEIKTTSLLANLFESFFQLNGEDHPDHHFSGRPSYIPAHIQS